MLFIVSHNELREFGRDIFGSGVRVAYILVSSSWVVFNMILFRLLFVGMMSIIESRFRRRNQNNN